MAGPSLDLQKAIIAVLRTAPTVTALVGTRIFDEPPTSAPFPYVSYGADQVVSNNAECITSYDVTVNLEVWSRKVGQTEMKQIGDAIKRALHEADLNLDDHALVSLEHDVTFPVGDPDGLTSHGIVRFRALVDEAAGS